MSSIMNFEATEIYPPFYSLYGINCKFWKNIATKDGTYRMKFRDCALLASSEGEASARRK